MTISHESLIRRQQAVQDALVSAVREGQAVSPKTEADMEAYGRGEITTDEVRHRILARLHADPRYQNHQSSIA